MKSIRFENKITYCGIKIPLDHQDVKERLEKEELEITEENIFIAVACDEKGIAFLKGESPLNVRKISNKETEEENKGEKENGK